jgi:hypothetical protein
MMPLDDAKMVVVPAATPVARPAALMVATEVFDDAHLALAVMSLAVMLSLQPPPKTPVALNCWVLPGGIDALNG